MPYPSAKRAQKIVKLRTKREGTVIQLQWTEWPNGKPDVDETTGAALVSSDAPNKTPAPRSASVRAHVHFIAPTTSQNRKFAEMAVGDAIVDFPLDLIRVTDAGETSLLAGEIVDEISFSMANRTVTESALGESVNIEDLENVKLSFGGWDWAQKEIGEELVRSWDTLYSGLNINRAILVTITGRTTGTSIPQTGLGLVNLPGENIIDGGVI